MTYFEDFIFHSCSSSNKHDNNNIHKHLSQRGNIFAFILSLKYAIPTDLLVGQRLYLRRPFPAFYRLFRGQECPCMLRCTEAERNRQRFIFADLLIFRGRSCRYYRSLASKRRHKIFFLEGKTIIWRLVVYFCLRSS
jgi:hypothetical protein